MPKHEFSLAAKLAALGVGEHLYLPDPGWDPEVLAPTPVERGVHTAVARSPRVRGRKFRTARGDVLINRVCDPVLRVTRVE